MHVQHEAEDGPNEAQDGHDQGPDGQYEAQGSQDQAEDGQDEALPVRRLCPYFGVGKMKKKTMKTSWERRYG